MSKRRSSKRGSNHVLPGQLDMFSPSESPPPVAPQLTMPPSLANEHVPGSGHAAVIRTPARGAAKELKTSRPHTTPRGADAPKRSKINISAVAPDLSPDQRNAGAGKDLLDTRAAARLLGLGASTLEKMRSQKRGPRYVKLTNAAVRYHPDALEAWVASRTCAPDP